MSASALRHKKTVSVTLDPTLYQQARQAGLNMSATLTSALQQALRQTEITEWKQDNLNALLELNRLTDEYGLLSDEHRAF